MTTVDPSEKVYELDPVVTRVLKRGDLTRINSNKPGKLKDHHGDLARVVKAEPVGPTLENSHPFVYDLELVLGGKLHGIFRADLLYTTATKEGMLDDSRCRRKRKPSTIYDLEPEKDDGKKTKGRPGPKKKGAGAKKIKAVASSSSSSSKKRPANHDNVKGSTAKKPKTNTAQEDNSSSAVAVAAAQADLFDRHKREFERSLGRLEKADAYNFFGTAVPPDFEESYARVDEKESQSPADNASLPLPSASAQHLELTNQSRATSENGLASTKQDDDAVYFPPTPPFNFVVIRRRMELGRYILDRVRIENEERIDLLTPYWKSIGRKNIKRRPKKSLIPVLHPNGVNWDLFRKDIHAMCDSAVERNKHLDDHSPGTLHHAAARIKDLMEHIYEKNGKRHYIEMEAANHRHRFSLAMQQTTNTEAAMQGKWKKDAFPERKYERLRGDIVCAGLSELDQKIAAYELKTSLEDKFIGLAYKYDDTGQSEGWMKSILDVAGNKRERKQAAIALASDDGAIKAQVSASMQSLLIGVLDKVMTDSGVLQQKELLCANEDNDFFSQKKPEFIVQEVWGIDCYTRRNVSICLEIEFESDVVQTFTEKWLLPAINACPADLAYDIGNACRILEGLPFDMSTSLKSEKGTTYEQWADSLLGKALLDKILAFGPPWLHAAARLLRLARENLGPDFFRIHPKGHGSIVLCEKLEPNRLVTFYRGEVYPAWRWGEKIDAIAKIQHQKGLKPVLPDFFNMALERPQHDPRGYGLLFVDASRKSNYGSMLSHSCQPSCEVHVVAVNGELRLAITTIREMSIGDELTFDYNAVTESLMEYQSAVCLCGHKRCSGSFLHFAAADCYQQVLNRNSPVASRLANLIKGCTKKVMSDDDDKILKRHGFQTAAFGAVSVNRRNARALRNLDTALDSMNIVPVWLRTYVADTLRYIEYERRALPIALICNDLYDETGNMPAPEPETKDDNESEGLTSDDEDSDSGSDQSAKPRKRSKPEPTFFYYARTQREYFESLLADDEDKNTITGAEMKREVQKLASAHWKSLDVAAKEEWKTQAFEEWRRNQRNEDGSEQRKKKRVKRSKESVSQLQKNGGCLKVEKRKISFQQADAEGVSAMEQRIQQLTQTLSRVGRVLDRHREAKLRLMAGSDPSISDEALREVAHSPLVIMPDELVVAWMWNHKDGVVQRLLTHTENDTCVSPELRQSIIDTASRHSILERFGDPSDPPDATALPLSPAEGRERLNEALLELRKDLLDGIQQMTSVIKKHKARIRAITKKKERENASTVGSLSDDKQIRSTVTLVMEEIITSLERRFGSLSRENGITPLEASSEAQHAEHGVGDCNPDEDLEPWLRNFNKRFKIEKAADLLLLYAKTGFFFSIQTYKPLKSSQIEVYARELGNAVPASTVDRDLLNEPPSVASSPGHSPSMDVDVESSQVDMADGVEEAANAKNPRKLCEPEDIISNVVVEYQGDYVLSQLLQWYNAGIGQKPGLPEMLGCVLLPSMKGCWTVDGTTVSNSYTDRATRYQASTRRRLLDWFKDPLQRGNPWPDEIRRAFLEKDDGIVSDATRKWHPLGSPILDFLVTGDDHNMNSVMATLESFHSNSGRSGNSSGSGLLSTVDEGRPAEAVSNWVQCENPNCQKWRKVPWHIDIDALPEQFFCKDNFWNSKSASCDAPEDEWDQTADAQIGLEEDTTTLMETLEKSKIFVNDQIQSLKLGDFQIGAKFDILRDNRMDWVVGTIVDKELSEEPQRVKFHYAKMSRKQDEWIEIDSGRIAPFHSRTKVLPKKEKADDNSKQASKKARMALLKKAKKKADGSKNGSPLQIEDQPLVVPTDNSFMTDVFTQGSSDDDDGKNISHPVQSKPFSQGSPSLRDTDAEESDDLPDSSEPEYDDLEDSDEENENVSAKSTKIRPPAVTDESSPDPCENQNDQSSDIWRIPKKKKKTPAKSGILSISSVDLTENDKPTSVANPEPLRIPRKTLGATSSQRMPVPPTASQSSLQPAHEVSSQRPSANTSSKRHTDAIPSKRSSLDNPRPDYTASRKENRHHSGNGSNAGHSAHPRHGEEGPAQRMGSQFNSHASPGSFRRLQSPQSRTTPDRTREEARGLDRNSAWQSPSQDTSPARKQRYTENPENDEFNRRDWGSPNRPNSRSRERTGQMPRWPSHDGNGKMFPRPSRYDRAEEIPSNRSYQNGADGMPPGRPHYDREGPARRDMVDQTPGRFEQYQADMGRVRQVDERYNRHYDDARERDAYFRRYEYPAYDYPVVDGRDRYGDRRSYDREEFRNFRRNSRERVPREYIDERRSRQRYDRPHDVGRYDQYATSSGALPESYYDGYYGEYDRGRDQDYYAYDRYDYDRYDESSRKDRRSRRSKERSKDRDRSKRRSSSERKRRHRERDDSSRRGGAGADHERSRHENDLGWDEGSRNGRVSADPPR